MTDYPDMEHGRKDDTMKRRYDLVPVHALAEVADVLTFGAQKYDDENWRKVENPERRYIAAAMRHIEAFRAGESYDRESRKHHLAHACCCLMFIMETKAELQDLIEVPTTSRETGKCADAALDYDIAGDGD